VLLTDSLRAAGRDVIATREPGGSPGAEVLRALLLDPRGDWAPLTETLLHFAARADHVASAIRPALASGTWVVSDRFYDSTMAYQGYGQLADRAAIAQLTALIGVRPDLTLVLDVGEATARTRMIGRGRSPDRYEREGAAFHERVRAGYRAIAAAEPDRCVLIDADGAPDAVHDAIMATVRERLA
jgi:dTMP kinase